MTTENHFIQNILTNTFPGDFMLDFYIRKYFSGHNLQHTLCKVSWTGRR